jgi:predicted nucleic acid-binding protein
MRCVRCQADNSPAGRLCSSSGAPLGRSCPQCGAAPVDVLPNADIAVSPPVPEAPGELPRIVLDTNAVLDWLYFRDPRSAALAEAVTTGRVRWIASAAMRDEIEHVLARGSLGAKWPDGAASVREGWRRWATMVDADPPESPAALLCSDADDQKFIDLAVDVRAAALLSADRAVLRLARRAVAWGLAITTVERWRPEPRT